MVYKIKQGNRTAKWPNFKFSRKNKVKGTIKFLGDVSYYLNNQTTVHRLISLSKCALAWRFDASLKQVEILTVVDGYESHLCYCESNVDYEYEIIINKGYTIFRFETDIKIKKRDNANSIFRKIHFPKFCGAQKSPRNIYIKITVE